MLNCMGIVCEHVMARLCCKDWYHLWLKLITDVYLLLASIKKYNNLIFLHAACLILELSSWNWCALPMALWALPIRQCVTQKFKDLPYLREQQ